MSQKGGSSGSSCGAIAGLARRVRMGFATIGRMTSEHWVCCASYDEVGFGMTPEGKLSDQWTELFASWLRARGLLTR